MKASECTIVLFSDVYEYITGHCVRQHAMGYSKLQSHVTQS